MWHAIKLLVHLQAAAALPGNEQKGSEVAVGKASVPDVELLIQQGLAINLRLNSLQQLQQMLQQHYAVQLRMEHVLGVLCSTLLTNLHTF